jgi:hypothetical protein
VLVLFINFAQRIRVATVEPPNQLHLSEHMPLPPLLNLPVHTHLLQQFGQAF